MLLPDLAWQFQDHNMRHYATHRYFNQCTEAQVLWDFGLELAPTTSRTHPLKKHGRLFSAYRRSAMRASMTSGDSGTHETLPRNPPPPFGTCQPPHPERHIPAFVGSVWLPRRHAHGGLTGDFAPMEKELCPRQRQLFRDAQECSGLGVMVDMVGELF